MQILSFDTSTPVMHLALLAGRQPWVAKTVEPASLNRQEVASLLIPEIDKAFIEAGWNKHDLSLIVVGTGPGSFTGIRVGVITARSLAQALKLPLIGISAFESLAANLPLPAGIVLGAGNDHYFVAGFQRCPEQVLAPVVEPCYVSASELAGRLSLIESWAADEKACLAGLPEPVKPLPAINNIAVAQAELAFDRLSLKGPYTESVDRYPRLQEEFPWWNVLPLYLRSPSVTVKKSNGNTNPTHDAIRS